MNLRIVLMLLALPFTPAGPALRAADGTQADFLDAPYQIDGIGQDAQEATRYGDAPAFGVSRVLVDLGSAESRQKPAQDRFASVTLIGTRGIVPGTLGEITKVCRYLCGDDGEACHYVASVTPTRSLDELGTPVAAIPGGLELSAYRVMSGELHSAGEIRPEWLGRDFTVDAWSASSDQPAGYRLVGAQAAGEGLAIETRYDQGQTYRYDAGECREARREPFEMLACSMFATLLHDGRPLLVSLADYNMPTAEVLARFDNDGRTYYVVRLGLKAQTVVGLLVHTAKGWKAILRPRDYAQLC